MYCPYCGARIPDTSKFCPSCGKAIPANDMPDLGTRPSAPIGPEPSRGARPEGDHARPTLQNPLLKPLRIGGASVPALAIVLVCVLVVCGVAFGATSLFKGSNPSPVIQQSSECDSTEGDAPAESDEGEGVVENAESGNEEEGVLRTTGDSDNFLQLAEQLSLDPNELYISCQLMSSSRLDSALGFANVSSGDNVWEPTTDTVYAAWQLDDEGVFGDYLAEAGLETSSEYGAPGSLFLGMGLTPAPHVNEPYNQVSSLGNYYTSEVPDSVLLNLALVAPLTEDEISHLRETCRFTGAAQRFDYEQGDSYGTQSGTVLTGLVDVNDETKVWYVSLSNSKGSFDWTSLTLGVTTLDAAQAVVDVTELHEADAWDGAEDDERLLMFAQGLAQDLVTGNGGMRTNVLTGEREILDMYWHWQPE